MGSDAGSPARQRSYQVSTTPLAAMTTMPVSVQRSGKVRKTSQPAIVDQTNFDAATFCNTLMPDGTERNDNC